ncbi:MAG: undecaprenyl-phosphate galactose phosphotransferase WbaP [Firmicutes bacterium]|nr:undecaprenyl-phosphate galactose phosphotransferase WbaP [Bacillota bacterium]
MGKTAKSIKIRTDLFEIELNQSLPQKSSHHETKFMLIILSLVTTDLIGLSLAILTGVLIRLKLIPMLNPGIIQNIPDSFISNLWLITFILIACLAYERTYTQRQSFWSEARNIVTATTMAFFITLATVFLTRLGDEFSRTTIFITYIFALFTLPMVRYFGKIFLFYLGIWAEPILILGAGDTGKKIAVSFITQPFIGYQIFGFLDDDKNKMYEGVNILGKDYRVFGGFDEATRIIRENNIANAVIAVPRMYGEDLVQLAYKLKHSTRNVIVAPDIAGMSITGGQITHLFDEKILLYSTQNNLVRPLNMLIKRLFDIIVGFSIFIFLFPVLLLISLMIKIDTRGPMGFSHKRVGKGGKEFNCYKFRTMATNSQEILQRLLETDPEIKKEWEENFKLKDDPRVTRVGKILRRTSLDELPQILNVLKGEMSLVGPRPIVMDEVPKFGKYAPDYFMVLPGITGLWGVSGRSDIEYNERVQMEAWYVRNWSLWLDITLLFKTVGVVLGKKGAY